VNVGGCVRKTITRPHKRETRMHNAAVAVAVAFTVTLSFSHWVSQSVFFEPGVLAIEINKLAHTTNLCGWQTGWSTHARKAGKWKIKIQHFAIVSNEVRREALQRPEETKPMQQNIVNSFAYNSLHFRPNPIEVGRIYRYIYTHI